MIKTITIDENTTLTLSNNIGFMLAYENQFGEDVFQIASPVLRALISILDEMREHLDGDALTAEALKSIDANTLQDAVIELTGLKLADIIRIIWSMAKAADGEIAEPKEWVKQFDSFPLDIIIPEVFDLLVSGFKSSKN